MVNYKKVAFITVFTLSGAFVFDSAYSLVYSEYMLSKYHKTFNKTLSLSHKMHDDEIRKDTASYKKHLKEYYDELDKQHSYYVNARNSESLFSKLVNSR